MSIILTINLKLIPEEANEKDIVIEEAKKKAFKEYLAQNVEQNVIQILHNATLEANITRKREYEVNMT